MRVKYSSIFRELLMTNLPFDTQIDTQVVQKQYQDFHAALLNVMDSLSSISNPVASSAIQDLSELANSMQQLRSCNSPSKLSIDMDLIWV